MALANGAADSVRVGLRLDGSTLVLALAGEWTLEQSIPGFDRLVEDFEGRPAPDAISFDTRELGAWDSSLLMFLVRGRSYCETHDLDFRAESLPESIGGLLDLTRAVNRDEGERLGIARHARERMGMVRGLVWGLRDGIGDRPSIGTCVDVEQQSSVALHGSSGEQRGSLGNEPDLLPRTSDVRTSAVDRDRSGRRRSEAGDHPQQGRLATPARADQGHDLSWRDRQVDRRQGLEFAESFRDPVHGDTRALTRGVCC